MIEIKITKEDDSELIRLEVNGDNVGDAYNPKVPPMLLQAAANYMESMTDLGIVDAVLNIFKGIAGYLKLAGIPRSDLHNLIASAPTKLDTSTRH